MPFEASRVVFWSLSCYKELKLTTNRFTGGTLRGLLIQMQNISLRSSGMHRKQNSRKKVWKKYIWQMYFIYTFFLEVQTRYTSNVLFFWEVHIKYTWNILKVYLISTRDGAFVGIRWNIQDSGKSSCNDLCGFQDDGHCSCKDFWV